MRKWDVAGSGEPARKSVVTVFCSRLAPGAEAEYGPLAAAIEARASAMPGFVDFKSFSAPDGERVAIVTFATWEDHARWRDDPVHRDAQLRGIERLYTSYAITVTEEIATRRFPGG